jgi:hypothetical protein
MNYWRMDINQKINVKSWYYNEEGSVMDNSYMTHFPYNFDRPCFGKKMFRSKTKYCGIDIFKNKPDQLTLSI